MSDADGAMTVAKAKKVRPWLSSSLHPATESHVAFSPRGRRKALVLLIMLHKH